MVALPLMSFSRSKTTNAYPRCGFFFLFGFSSWWVSLTMRICHTVSGCMLLRMICCTYAFNGTEAAELALEVLLIRVVCKASDNKSLECIPSDVWVLVWVIYNSSQQCSYKRFSCNDSRGCEPAISWEPHSYQVPPLRASPASPSSLV